MNLLCETPSPSRRALLAATGGLFAWAYLPKFARAADQRDPRLVVIILRGALDGLSAVAPIGDPDYAGLHGQIALSLSGDHPAIPLDSFFALNPAMPVFARLYRAGQGAVVHAVATPYRERSHFDGQDVLESGFPGPGRVGSGWLNRAIAALPRGAPVAVRGGLGVGATTPLIMRGQAPVLGCRKPCRSRRRISPIACSISIAISIPFLPRLSCKGSQPRRLLAARWTKRRAAVLRQRRVCARQRKVPRG